MQAVGGLNCSAETAKSLVIIFVGIVLRRVKTHTVNLEVLKIGPLSGNDRSGQSSHRNQQTDRYNYSGTEICCVRLGRDEKRKNWVETSKSAREGVMGESDFDVKTIWARGNQVQHLDRGDCSWRWLVTE